VHFWFFFDSGCYGCMKVYNGVLPRILANYEPGQVTMHTWDVTRFGVAVQRALEQQYGIVSGDNTEIFIGEYALLGSQEIEARLPRLIDQYLAQGGVALVELTVATPPTTTRTLTRPPSPIPTTSAQASVVRAVLFWSKTCPNCHVVIEQVLPPLQRKYGNRLDIRMFELSDPTNLEMFEATLEALRVPSDQWGVPFMIVGDEIMVGSLEIPERLQSLIEKHLAKGGIGWPSIPGLENFVGAPMATPTRAATLITPTRSPTPAVRVVVNDTPVPPTPAPPTIIAFVPSKPVVRAVMFWMKGCQHCEEVLARVLPPLQQKHGVQLDIRLIEVVTTQDVDQLYQIAASFGIPKDQAGVPFLVIGNQALVGSDQIPIELPRLIEKHLAAGGVDWPSLTGMMPSAATPSSSSPICPPTTTDCGTDSTITELPVQTILRQDPVGFALAMVVILGMLGTLVRVGVDVIARRPNVSSAWETWAVPILVVLGLGVAGYLAYVEIFEVSAICGPVGHCNTVQESPYARVFGVLPIGVLGVLGYLAILGAWLIGQVGRGEFARWARRAAFAFAVFGVLFSLYLTLLEPFVIGAVCAWCLSSAVIMAALMFILTRSTR
jgi:uncharacterized membrane protein/thiol-disulfide isomerase/thioredoxin